MRPYLIGYKHIIDLDKVVQVTGPFNGDEIRCNDRFTIFLEGGYEIEIGDSQYTGFPKYNDFMKEWTGDEEFVI